MDYKKIMDSLFKENFELEQQRDQLKAERESMISDFQKKLDLVRMLKDENRKLETQKIAFQRSYKQVYEENEKLEQIRDFKDSALKGADIKIKTLERENEELRSRLDEFLEHDYDNQKLYEEMKRENEKLKKELLQSDYVKASVLSDREEYKKQIVKLHEELLNKNRIISKRLEESEILSENEKLKEENEKLKDKLKD